MILQNLKRGFVWGLAFVEDDVIDVIMSLVTKRSNEICYPKFIEIQKAVEEYLEITESDKWPILGRSFIKCIVDSKNL